MENITFGEWKRQGRSKILIRLEVWKSDIVLYADLIFSCLWTTLWCLGAMICQKLHIIDQPFDKVPFESLYDHPVYKKSLECDKKM